MNPNPGRSPGQEPDWTRAAAEFGLSALMWHGMADSAYQQPRPEYGHLATDFGGQVGHLYRKLALVAESFQDQCREIAYALAHPACEGDCEESLCRDVGRLDDERPPRNFAVVRDSA